MLTQLTFASTYHVRNLSVYLGRIQRNRCMVSGFGKLVKHGECDGECCQLDRITKLLGMFVMDYLV